MSKLLIDENPLQILPTAAKLIGLNEAIILQQIHYWLENARKGMNESKFKKGKFWVYNTYEEWKAQFPFWSDSTIKRAILSLEEKKLITSEQFEGSHRRKWYTINYQEVEALETQVEKEIEAIRSKRPVGTGQDDPFFITENTNRDNGDYLYKLEQEFYRVSNIPIPEWEKKGGLRQRRWRSPLKRMYQNTQESLEETEKYIGEAVRYMRKEGLTMSAPESIEKVFIDLYAKRNTTPQEAMPYA